MIANRTIVINSSSWRERIRVAHVWYSTVSSTWIAYPKLYSTATDCAYVNTIALGVKIYSVYCMFQRDIDIRAIIRQEVS